MEHDIENSHNDVYPIVFLYIQTSHLLCIYIILSKKEKDG